MVLTIHTVKCASLMMALIFFCPSVNAAVKRLSVLDNGSLKIQWFKGHFSKPSKFFKSVSI